MGTETTSDTERVLFSAELRPHRSIDLKGIHVAMLGVAFLLVPAGVVFIATGAWPVTGFMGLEILLLYGAFRLNLFRSKMRETVSVTPGRLTVDRVDHWGKLKSWEFQPHWLQVSMDNPPKHGSRLELRSHGKALIIGAFLTPTERLEVADALRNALIEAREADLVPG